MSLWNAGERVLREVSSWPGVSSRPGRFGSIEFVVGGQPLGHIHGDALLDAPVGRGEKERLIAEGRAIEHRFTPPSSGWITVPFRTEADVAQAISILKVAYARASK